MKARFSDRLRRARFALKRLAYSGLRRGRWQLPDRVVAELGLAPGDRVADLGAGAGYFTHLLAREVGPSGKVYALHTDPDMATTLAEHVARGGLTNVVPMAVDAEDPRLPEPVDLVFLADTYHHLPDRRRYLTELARYLAPRSRVAVVEPKVQGLHRIFGHATPAETIHSEFREAGYRLVAEHDFLSRQSFLVFERAS
jgi:arsenite methyltransferase